MDNLNNLLRKVLALKINYVCQVLIPTRKQKSISKILQLVPAILQN